MTTEIITELKVPTVDPNKDKSISMLEGGVLFVLGANGTGKSRLMQKFATQLAKAKRITAHRQNWFANDFVNMTREERENLKNNIRFYDQDPVSITKDSFPSQRPAAAMYDLISEVNKIARSITHAMETAGKDHAYEVFKERPDPLKLINEILRLSNLHIKLSINDDKILASKDGSEPYNISALSDGERNVLLMAIDVLIAEKGTFFIIDEPERHLHRAITSPLLLTLFSKRPDCSFIISTHDVSLVIDHPSAQALLIRDCIFKNNTITGWDCDLLPIGMEIDNEIKEDILGSRRKVLFVEGEENSLDKPIYSLIFPNVSVIAKSGCRNVIKAVTAIGKSDSLHWIKAFGVIDNDGRVENDTTKLLEDNIYPLEVFSVESIYYHPEIQGRVLRSLYPNNDSANTTKLNNAKEAALNIISKNIEALCIKSAYKKVREEFFKSIPTLDNVRFNTVKPISIDSSKYVKEECDKLHKFLDDSNISAIIENYPVREMGVLKEITSKLGFHSNTEYEEQVKQLMVDDITALGFVKSLFGNLVSDIER